MDEEEWKIRYFPVVLGINECGNSISQSLVSLRCVENINVGKSVSLKYRTFAISKLCLKIILKWG